MTSPAYEIQALIVTTLKGRQAVMALINGVYDSVPTDPWGTKQAYISFGPTDVLIDDADCIDGEVHTVQLDVWSRTKGQVDCKRICDAVKDALHHESLELAANALADIELVLFRVLRDPDGMTTHGVMQFTVTVEAL